MQYQKKYVDVQADFDTQGNITPRIIEWPDGVRYEIAKVLDVCKAASTKVGGAGLRYSIRIVWDTPDGEVRSGESYLYLEENKWFVEEKVAM